MDPNRRGSTILDTLSVKESSTTTEQEKSDNSINKATFQLRKQLWSQGEGWGDLMTSDTDPTEHTNGFAGDACSECGTISNCNTRRSNCRVVTFHGINYVCLKQCSNNGRTRGELRRTIPYKGIRMVYGEKMVGGRAGPVRERRKYTFMGWRTRKTGREKAAWTAQTLDSPRLTGISQAIC